ncbi:MAG TPA: MAPEG family protein [Acetobacteraceae bacterium]|jgi:uncharacterized MAPEG superfamily protein|nr:MAPEG family protein [Acetobacteraceae bacterium]
MPIEIRMLAYSATLCVLLAVPYTVGLILERGLPTVAGNREPFAAGTGWIGRSQRAHRNLVENLVPFAALLLSVVITNKLDPTTALAARLFFYARLAHAVVYLAGIPWLRTLAFALGVVAMAMLLIVLLG